MCSYIDTLMLCRQREPRRQELLGSMVWVAPNYFYQVSDIISLFVSLCVTVFILNLGILRDTKHRQIKYVLHVIMWLMGSLTL